MKHSNDILDQNSLNALTEVLGKDKMGELIAIFLEKSEEILADLKQSTDQDFIYKKAHEMKGMAANYGFVDMSAKAKTIESAKDEGADEIKARIDQLESAHGHAKQAIQEWLAT